MVVMLGGTGSFLRRCLTSGAYPSRPRAGCHCDDGMPGPRAQGKRGRGEHQPSRMASGERDTRWEAPALAAARAAAAAVCRRCARGGHMAPRLAARTVRGDDEAKGILFECLASHRKLALEQLKRLDDAGHEIGGAVGLHRVNRRNCFLTPCGVALGPAQEHLSGTRSHEGAEAEGTGTSEGRARLAGVRTVAESE